MSVLLENEKIIFTTELKDSNLIMTFTDHGIGIPDSDKPHLFDRFFRAHNATNIQGTGLGLNIVSKYIELMDGAIEVHSVENKGTTFTLTFSQ